MDTWKNSDVPHRGNIRINPAYYIPPHQVVLFSGVQFRVAGHIIITLGQELCLGSADKVR